MKLWLVRHARAVIDAGVCYGATDLPADAAGTDTAARALATVLPQHLPVRCSPLRRCTALADALQALRPDLVWQADARLAEMDFGCWEGRAWADIDPAEFDRWTADFSCYRCGGRESVREFMARVAAARADARCCGQAMAWICHAGVIRAAQLLARGEFPTEAGAWPRGTVAYGDWQCLDWPPPDCAVQSSS